MIVDCVERGLGGAGGIHCGGVRMRDSWSS